MPSGGPSLVKVQAYLFPLKKKLRNLFNNTPTLLMRRLIMVVVVVKVRRNVCTQAVLAAINSFFNVRTIIVSQLGGRRAKTLTSTFRALRAERAKQNARVVSSLFASRLSPCQLLFPIRCGDVRFLSPCSRTVLR